MYAIKLIIVIVTMAVTIIVLILLITIIELSSSNIMVFTSFLLFLEFRNNILSEHMYVFDRDVNNWLDMAPSSEYMYVLFYRNPRNDISLGMCDMSLA